MQSQTRDLPAVYTTGSVCWEYDRGRCWRLKSAQHNGQIGIRPIPRYSGLVQKCARCVRRGEVTRGHGRQRREPATHDLGWLLQAGSCPSSSLTPPPATSFLCTCPETHSFRRQSITATSVLMTKCQRALSQAQVSRSHGFLDILTRTSFYYITCTGTKSGFLSLPTEHCRSQASPPSYFCRPSQ